MTEDIHSLASLEFIPYIDSEGKLPDFFQRESPAICRLFSRYLPQPQTAFGTPNPILLLAESPNYRETQPHYSRKHSIELDCRKRLPTPRQWCRCCQVERSHRHQNCDDTFIICRFLGRHHSFGVDGIVPLGSIDTIALGLATVFGNPTRSNAF